MKTVYGGGSHYTMMSLQAVATSNAVNIFLQQCGHNLQRPSSAPLSGISCLREGDEKAPSLYMVHGIDGDVFGVGQAHKTIAGVLEPCRVCAMVYTEDALACESMPALCAFYNRFVLEDLRRCGRKLDDAERGAVIITGHSFGCVIAHQMALQLQFQGLEVRLVLFDMEVKYPPPASNDRLGGYEWMGGDIEASLLICRSIGHFEMANQQVMTLLSQKKDERDVKGFKERVSKAASERGMKEDLFHHFVDKAGRNMEQLNKIASPWEPPAVFDGETLMVLAPESPEFARAKEVNQPFCSRMKTVYGGGSHYTMMSLQAVATAHSMGEFLAGCGMLPSKK